MKNQDETKRGDRKPNRHALLARLPIAMIALVFCVILIIWDMGIIDLPFLKRIQRRDPAPSTNITEENKEENQTLTLEEQIIDWPEFAAQQINALYDYSFLDAGERAVPDTPYDPNTMSLVKIRLPQKKYSLSMGYLISPDGKLYWAKDLTPIAGSEDYRFTGMQDSVGNAIFKSKTSEEYYLLDHENSLWLPIVLDFETQAKEPALPLPATYGIGQENTALTVANGLYGYTGTYVEKRRTKTFTVENVYSVGFAYSEGFAVMADETGALTIRNDRGEVVFDHLTLRLSERGGTDALGFHYFDHGMLRVEFATYDENGTLTETREGVINSLGQEVVFPHGYFALSYLDGVFVLSDGKNTGYYDAKGSWLTSPIYAKAFPFFEGVAVVENAQGKQGLIDRTGKEILSPAFDSISFSQDGLILATDKAAGSYLLVRVMKSDRSHVVL